PDSRQVSRAAPSPGASTSSGDPMLSRPRGLWIAALVLLAAVTASAPAHAQTLSAADLAGTWSVFQLVTPASNVTGPGVRTYRGTITLDDAGAVTAGILSDDPIVYSVSGALTVSVAGLLD